MMAHDVLVKAKAEIDSPEKWCQNTWGDDRRKCTVAALYAGAGQKLDVFAMVSPSDSLLDAAIALQEAAPFSIKSTNFAELMNSLCGINNAYMHDELMAVFDRAIEVTKPAPIVEGELVTA